MSSGRLAVSVVVTAVVVTAVVVAAVVVAAAVLGDDAAPSATTAAPRVVGAAPTAPGGASPAPPSVVTSVAPRAAPAAGSELLLPADHGDGDSWRDTEGREYRLGLVNTPEQGECFGAEATAERRALTEGGFRARVYANDRHGRAVSVVTTADGRNLNVHLARHGFADDRYLAEFRSEDEQLARELDAAFAAARREGKGLWSACGSRDAPVAAPVPAAPAAAAAAGCHPDYVTCVAVHGDGTGHGGANDLDCGDVTGAVQVRQPGADPYRFDADGDGVGCDS